MDYSDAIDITATPEAAFAVLSDLGAMGRLSLENTGGRWLDDASGPKLGARFEGDNTQGEDSWSTVAEVVTCEPPRCFAFEVTWQQHPISRWEFCVEATLAGCRVEEHWTDRRDEEMRADGDSDDFSRVEFTKLSIRTTLERLKTICEGAAA